MPNSTTNERNFQRQGGYLAGQRQRLMSAGLAVIPLSGKTPPACVASWQHIPIGEQWRLANDSAGGAWRGNLGIVAGNGTAFIDCDSPQSVQNVQQLLAGLAGPTATGKPGKYAAYAGKTAPRVQTAHGGLHVYLRVKDVPDGFNWGQLPPDIGAGELRVRNAYVVAPPSKLADGTRYKWQQGQPEALADLPPISWGDLVSMGLVTQTALAGWQLPDIPLLRRPAPEYATQLALILGTAAPGQPVMGYDSRSEAEAAIVAHLILSGWPFDDIARFFEEKAPGTYASKTTAQRDSYLKRTYSRVLAVLKADRDRLHLAQLYEQADRAAWPGRGGASDKRTYQAVLGLAWPAGRLQLSVASRDIAQLAAIDDRTARTARRRLAEAGLLHYLGRAVDSDGQPAYDKASWYRITGNMPAPAAQPETPLNTTATAAGGLELWAWQRLGHSTELVYKHLPEHTTASTAQLIAVTGKHRNTVTKALQRLAQYGLAATNGKSRAGCRWGRGPVTVLQVARQWGAGKEAQRRATHIERDRAAHAFMLAVQQRRQCLQQQHAPAQSDSDGTRQPEAPPPVSEHAPAPAPAAKTPASRDGPRRFPSPCRHSRQPQSDSAGQVPAFPGNSAAFPAKPRASPPTA